MGDAPADPFPQRCVSRAPATAWRLALSADTSRLLAPDAVVIAVEVVRVGRRHREPALADVRTAQVGRRWRDARVWIGRIARALLDAPAPHAAPGRTGLALGGSKAVDVPDVRRIRGHEGVAVPVRTNLRIRSPEGVGFASPLAPLSCESLVQTLAMPDGSSGTRLAAFPPLCGASPARSGSIPMSSRHTNPPVRRSARQWATRRYPSPAPPPATWAQALARSVAHHDGGRNPASTYGAGLKIRCLPSWICSTRCA